MAYNVDRVRAIHEAIAKERQLLSKFEAETNDPRVAEWIITAHNHLRDAESVAKILSQGDRTSDDEILILAPAETFLGFAVRERAEVQLALKQQDPKTT